MISISFIQKLGFSITWPIVLVGWQGPGNFHRQLTLKDVQQFAEQTITSADKEEIPDVAELTMSCDEQLVHEALQRLAAEDTQRALDIWIVALLKQLVENLPQDPLAGMQELTSFWSHFDYPARSPHIIQGVKNNIEPEYYYTARNYDEAIASHKKWLADEIARIQSE